MHQDNVAIAGSKVGLVIGKGGATIKRIQQEYGVVLNVTSDDRTGQANVKISAKDKVHVQKARLEVEALVKDRSKGHHRGGRGGGRTGEHWAAIKRRREKTLEQLQQFKPTKVHLGADSRDMVLNLLRYLATGIDTQEMVAAVAGSSGADDEDIADARERRYKEVKAKQRIARENAKALKKMTKQDRVENGIVVGEGWSGTGSKGRDKEVLRCFGDPAKLKGKVRLKVCFDKNPQEQKTVLIARSDGLKGLLKKAKGTLKTKKGFNSAHLLSDEHPVQITDMEILSIKDDIVIAVSTEKMSSTEESAGAKHGQDKSSKTKQKIKEHDLTKVAKAPPQPPVASKGKAATVQKATGKSSAKAGTVDRQALTQFYKKYCPEKVDRIDVMLQKFEPEKIVGALRKKYGEVPELQFLLVSEPREPGDAVDVVPDSNVLGLSGGSNGGGAWWDETEEEEEELERLRAATRREEQEQKRVKEQEQVAEIAIAVQGTPQQQRLPMRANLHGMQLLELLQRNQVVVLAGETGCGKTTQAPQMLLEQWTHSMQTGGGGAGASTSINIICTQPRRISAITVAERVAEERGESCGETIGYQVRLQKKVSRQTRLTYCTTGILLRRMQEDPSLTGVTHLVLDEVHERDALTDFLLVLVKQLLPLRPSLRVLLMSATLDIDLFAGYFCTTDAPDGTDADNTRAPHLAVPGRTFPVQPFFMEDAIEATRYQPGMASSSYSRRQPSDSEVTSEQQKAEKEAEFARKQAEDLSAQQGTLLEYGQQTLRYVREAEGSNGAIDYGLIEATLAMLCDGDGAFSSRAGKGAGAQPALLQALSGMLTVEGADPPGSALVFLPGGYEIKECARTLRESGRFPASRVEILSLHSSVPPKEQRKAFQLPPPGKIKIVLATNIAETSVTIPDCVVVLDTGRVKETRFDPARGMVRLQEGWCSRASSKQRKGRAGRVRPGVCVHLFSRWQHRHSMDPFQLPELLRIPLDSLVLQLKSMKSFRSDSRGGSSCGVGGSGGGDKSDAFIADPREFLSRALEAPPTEQIEVAVKELQLIGALTASPEEALTPLGRHLAKLPLPPRLGKMLVLSCVFGCAGPCLSIAAGLSLQSPFVMPAVSASKKDKKRAEVARRELARRGTMGKPAGGFHSGGSVSKDGGSRSTGTGPVPTTSSEIPSDHLAMLAAYNGWCTAGYTDGNRGMQRFCNQYFLNAQTMRQINSTREQLASQLADIGLYRQRKENRRWRDEGEADEEQGAAVATQEFHFSERHKDSGALVKCLLCAALYPNVVRVVRVARRAGGGNLKGYTVKVIGKEGEVKVHPGSVLFPPADYQGAEWLVYLERVETSQIFVRDATAVSPYPLMLCGGVIDVKHHNSITVVDGWMQFEVEDEVGVLFKKLRTELNRVLLGLLEVGPDGKQEKEQAQLLNDDEGSETGTKQDDDITRGRKVIDAVVKLLEAEAREQQAATA